MGGSCFPGGPRLTASPLKLLTQDHPAIAEGGDQ